MKKLNITIAIPACNEESNIKNILEGILAQKCENFRIKTIWIVSDGSTDETVKLARSVKSNLIVVTDGKKRIGKIRRLNQIFSHFNGDILIQFDADVRLGHDRVIEQLVHPFLTKKVENVCGIGVPTKPHTFAEELSYFGYLVWDRCKKLHNDPIRYHVTGQIRAFSASFLKGLQLPAHKKDIMEDTYLYYWAVTKNKKVVLAKHAYIYYRLPNTFTDYRKQMKRFLKTPDFMERYFGDTWTKKLDVITNKTRLKALVIEGVKRPHIALCYLLLQSYVKLEARFSEPDAAWQLVTSSKKFADTK